MPGSTDWLSIFSHCLLLGTSSYGVYRISHSCQTSFAALSTFVSFDIVYTIVFISPSSIPPFPNMLGAGVLDPMSGGKVSNTHPLSIHHLSEWDLYSSAQSWDCASLILPHCDLPYLRSRKGHQGILRRKINMFYSGLMMITHWACFTSRNIPPRGIDASHHVTEISIYNLRRIIS